MTQRHDRLRPFALSLLLHILVLLCITVYFVKPVKEYPKPANHYVPAYFYQPPRHQAAYHPTAGAAMPKPVSKPTPQSAPRPMPSPSHVISTAPTRSLLTLSHDFLRQRQVDQAMQAPKEVEPVLLIGDKSKVVDPLILLMAKALSLHFHYPHVEGSFGVVGRVIMQLTLHPDGTFSDVQIVESSDNQDFDAAALYAVNNAPLAHGVDQFLSTPKSFVVGFVFD